MPSDLIDPIVGAIGRLVSLAEAIEDEWTYVHDLETVWVARLRAVAADRDAADREAPSREGPADEPGTAVSTARELQAALERLAAEADAITDPHRAIDWLSTLPQATLVALGADAW